MKSHLSESQVREILTSPASHSILGKQFGLHRTTISLIRLGKIHRHIAPDIPRWSTDRRCTTCIHWRSDHCGLGFPDPVEEGVAFARECAAFGGVS